MPFLKYKSIHLLQNQQPPSFFFFFFLQLMLPELEKARVMELQVRMDRNGCVQKIKEAMHNIDGVYDVYIDFAQQKSTVVGRADPDKILKAIKKTRKNATICSHTEPATTDQQPADNPPPPAEPEPPKEEPPAEEKKEEVQQPVDFNYILQAHTSESRPLQNTPD